MSSRRQAEWEYTTPAPLFSLVYILSVVLCLAVFVMLSWHLWAIAKGETSVESHDHDVYRKVASERGQDFINSYDLGYANGTRGGYDI